MMKLSLVLVLGLAAGPAMFGQQAADLYNDKCAVCHGADGAGKTAKGKKVKALDVRETIKKLSPDAMLLILSNGKGVDMEAFGKVFTADQLKALVAYYRGLAK